MALERELRRLRMPRGWENGGDLSSSHYALLRVIGDSTDHTVGSVAEALRVHQSTTSRQIANAEALGLLNYTSRSDDHRVKYLSITATGRDRLNEARRHSTDILSDAFTGWSATDLREFTRLLHRLNAALLER